MVPISSTNSGKNPQKLKDGLWVFPPNNLCNGGRSWWLGCDPEPVLIDCPPVNEGNIELLKNLSLGREPLIVLTNRESHGRVSQLQDVLGWKVLIQEQEAYLLPGLNQLESFAEEHVTGSGLRLLWTPGPTPGSCVIYAPLPWNVLFCGRLLIPLKLNSLAALRNRRTFHWTRQQKSLKKLRQWLPQELRPSLASGVESQNVKAGELVDWDGWEEPQS